MCTSKGGKQLKRCNKCGQLKEDHEFFKKRDRKSGLESSCKECWKKNYSTAAKQASQRYRLQRKLFLDSLKSPCVKCGESRPWVIQFHHVDPNAKLFNVTYSDGRTEHELRSEATKCVCLCSNCHDEFHYFYGRNPIDPVKSLTEYLESRGDKYPV